MSRPRKRLRKALATVVVVPLLSLLACGGIAAIYFPAEAIINGESTDMGYVPGPDTETEARIDLVFDSLLMIGMGVAMLALVVGGTIGFISFLRK